MDALDILLEHGREDYQGAYKRAFGPLVGRDWVRSLPAEERAIFSRMGREFAEFGHAGGVARAKTAKRDHRGRFISGAGQANPEPTTPDTYIPF